MGRPSPDLGALKGLGLSRDRLFPVCGTIYFEEQIKRFYFRLEASKAWRRCVSVPCCCTPAQSFSWVTQVSALDELECVCRCSACCCSAVDPYDRHCLYFDYSREMCVPKLMSNKFCLTLNSSPRAKVSFTLEEKAELQLVVSLRRAGGHTQGSWRWCGAAGAVVQGALASVRPSSQRESCFLGQPHTARLLVFPWRNLVCNFVTRRSFHRRLSPRDKHVHITDVSHYHLNVPLPHLTVQVLLSGLKVLLLQPILLHLHPNTSIWCYSMIYRVVGFEFCFSHFVRKTRATSINWSLRIAGDAP